jgi:hypothetical protein
VPTLEEEGEKLKMEKQMTIRDMCEVDELLADIKIIMARLLKRLNE